MDLIFSNLFWRKTRSDVPLTTVSICAFSLMQVNAPADTAERIWIDVYHINIATKSFLDLMNTAIDLLSSSFIGYLGDRIAAWFMSRGPQIVMAVILKMALVWFYYHPKLSNSTFEGQPVHGHNNVAINHFGNCTMVKEYVASQYFLKAPTTALHSRASDIANESLSGEMTFHYFWTRICFEILGLYVAMRSFASLTYELGSKPHQQVPIAISLNIGNMLGMIFVNACAVAVSSIFADDLIHQADIQWFISFLCASPLLLLVTVALPKAPERSTSSDSENVAVSSDSENFAVSLGSVIQNTVFRFLTFAFVFSSIAHVVPAALGGYVVKNVLLYENAARAAALIALSNEIVMLVTTFSLNALVRRGISLELLFVALCAVGVGYAIHLFIDVKVLQVQHYMTTKLLSSAAGVIAQMIKRQLLTDAIFYDSLLSGQLRSGLYGSADGAIHQMVQMVVQVLPTLMLVRLGYVNNGGCECGCGAPCPPHHRWICPGDIGYACSTSLAPINQPFWGDPDRTAPCTWQPDQVGSLIRVSAFYLNPLINVLVGLVLMFSPVSHEIRNEIASQAEARKQGKAVFDPITYKPVSKKLTISQGLSTLLSRDEYALLYKRAGVDNIMCRLRIRIVVGCMLTLVLLSLSVRHMKRLDIVTPFIAIAMSFLLWASWSSLKFQYLLARRSALRIHVNHCMFSEDAVDCYQRKGVKGVSSRCLGSVKSSWARLKASNSRAKHRSVWSL